MTSMSIKFTALLFVLIAGSCWVAADDKATRAGDSGDAKQATTEVEQEYKPKSKSELRRILTPIQFKVTQNEETEPAFRNLYWDNKRDGLYECIVCERELFSSRTKYKSGTGWPSFIPLIEATANVLILTGAAALFIITYEVRRKRKRVISALSQLRSLAHVIDAHQLTKDPHSTISKSRPTRHSPKRSLTPHDLARYLDYCSELLSLTGKVAFLYVQKFDDPVSVNAVNDLENLTIGLSRKIWQKIMLIRTEDNPDEVPPTDL